MMMKKIVFESWWRGNGAISSINKSPDWGRRKGTRGFDNPANIA